MDVQRVARLVKRTKADAWIVIFGSYGILQWFASQSLPCLGLFGRISHLSMAGAGPSKKVAHAAAARRLVELGHRRIVLLTRWAELSHSMRYFLDELKSLGIPVSDYKRPSFNNSPEDLQRSL